MNTPPSFWEITDAVNLREPEWGSAFRSPSFRGCELAGEVGEVCNEIKKLERADMGLVGGKEDTEGLADELGDVIICCELVAREYGIDLGDAVRQKFNKTSDKHRMTTKL